MTASDILRERARQTENVSSAAFAPTSPDLLRAVADLMEACVKHDPPRIRDRTQALCVVCCEFWQDGKAPQHAADCPLAALERLIEGERDADR